ncbi:MAG: DUF3341 domain-containing protein [Candidatus Marinamargulisbacteria bacterium]|jgi:hypothetical protein|nr:DUF3341 domain-containing protein [Candidatus Marinamargulisbacteria bacterium]|tara:strand:- start:183 stop:731 length:549 start_codon:yes stop_codon:yes gene_type:complete
MSDNQSPLYGVMAAFDSPDSLIFASKSVVKAGYCKFDTYTPFPVHGIEKAMNLKPSPLPWLVLCGGLFGASAGFGLQTWVSIKGYALVISGKPLFSYQAFVPVTFELMILFSAFAAVFGMFAINKLPQFYHPVFTQKCFESVTTDGFFLMIECADPQFDLAAVHQLLEKQGGFNIVDVRDEG